MRDVEILKILIDGGADANSVNNDDEMPLIIVDKRLAKKPEDDHLTKMQKYLVSVGAERSWRTGL